MGAKSAYVSDQLWRVAAASKEVSGTQAGPPTRSRTWPL